jgi:hypothetical protein
LRYANGWGRSDRYLRDILRYANVVGPRWGWGLEQDVGVVLGDLDSGGRSQDYVSVILAYSGEWRLEDYIGAVLTDRYSSGRPQDYIGVVLRDIDAFRRR